VVLQSALIVPVPEAEALVRPWRLATFGERTSIEIVAHVTLTVPFVRPSEIEESLVRELRTFFAAVAPFDYRLARVERFPEVLWLAPEPAERFVRLTEALVERYPAYPPYAGEFNEIVPHVTIAHGEFNRAAAAIEPSLPIAARATEARLLCEVEREGDRVRWVQRTRFAFGEADL
jgi:2'-5' RNA ligase